MIPQVVEIQPLPIFRLWVRFLDGSSGTVDLSHELWGSMFEPLTNPNVFDQVRVDPELETVVWPHGADLAPEFLYGAVQGQRPGVGGSNQRVASGGLEHQATPIGLISLCRLEIASIAGSLPPRRARAEALSRCSAAVPCSAARWSGVLGGCLAVMATHDSRSAS